MSPSRAYLPALDGIRAIAVLAVLGYHFGVPWLAGGLLGVGVFFTLSGCLITGILLSAYERTGGLELRRFWVHRARRLLPGLVLMLVVVLGTTALAQRGSLDQRWDQTLAAIFYVSNWTTIAGNVSYFDHFAGPGPLDHLWSLAVEEQFYLLWPLALLLLLRLLKLPVLNVARWTVVVGAVSFVLLALLASPGFDNTRAYEGTDTRAGELLVGAALAMVYGPLRHPWRIKLATWVIVDVAALAALVAMACLMVKTSEYSLFLYRGGLVVLSLTSAVLIAAVSYPASLVGRALGVAPLRWVGERSYGLYLWHMPIVAVVSQSTLAAHPVRTGVLLFLFTLLMADLVVPLDERIDRLMHDVHGLPTMWLTVKSRLSSGPWADDQMRLWNAALLRACSRYPNMRVYDWRSQVQDSWFISDGIHYTSAGYQQRARRTAEALAIAFPAHGTSPHSCFVRP